MKKEFEEFYENLKFNNIEKFNFAWNEMLKERKQYFKKFLILSCIIDVAIIFLVRVVFLMSEISFEFIRSFVIFICISVDFAIYDGVKMQFDDKEKKTKEYKELFKKNIIGELLNNFYDEVKYLPTNEISEDIYKEPKYKESYDTYKSSDYIEAKINNKYKIKMAQVKTFENIKEKSMKFEGLFYKIELDKSINNELLIRDNRKVNSKQSLKMDVEEFEKYFDVSCSSKIVGMQLLTHDFMEKLLDLRINIKVDISIYNNIIYFRFLTGEIFEIIDINKGALDKELIEKYFNVLKDIDYMLKFVIKTINEIEI